MQAQDATTVLLLKLWPRIEANKNRILVVVAVVTAILAAIWIFYAQRGQNEIAAGEALTQVTISQTATPEAYLKIASDYPNTAAGQRALLQGAETLFAAGQYADAQAQFQKFLDEHPDSEFFPQAELGVAASLAAQGKTDEAAGAYQRLMNGSNDATAANAAKFALAGIDEAKGNLTEALSYYEDVERANQNTSLGADAAWHIVQLKNKMPAASASAATTPTAVPFQPGK